MDNKGNILIIDLNIYKYCNNNLYNYLIMLHIFFALNYVLMIAK